MAEAANRGCGGCTRSLPKPWRSRPPPRKASLRNRNTAKSSASCTTRRATCASVRPRCRHAQRRQRGALLQHGAVLLAASPYTPALAGVAELSGRRLDAAVLAAATADCFMPHRLGHGPRRLDRRRTPSHRRPGGGEVFASRLERQTLIRDNGRWKKIKAPRRQANAAGPRGGDNRVDRRRSAAPMRRFVAARREGRRERTGRLGGFPCQPHAAGGARRSGAAVGPRTDSCCPFRSSAPRAGPPRKAPALGLRRLVGRLDRRAARRQRLGRLAVLRRRCARPFQERSRGRRRGRRRSRRRNRKRSSRCRSRSRPGGSGP